MNGKRAKALRRWREGNPLPEDMFRLKRTEQNPAATTPKATTERKRKKRNGLKATALAARIVPLIR